MLNLNFDITDEIQYALNNNVPVVALESTLISHGLPFPKNIEVAKESIEAIRSNNSVPATIGIINGRIKIGLSKDDMNILAENTNIDKVSIHNLAISLSNKTNGATTVASTIYLASKVGIKFFSTGGIGGVHIDSENTFDVSSDLNQLSKTTMYVICSGAKSILDINKTYEKLETLGISRIGFNTDYMPGFWYYQTDKKVDYNYKSTDELTKFLIIREIIKQKSSVLIFNPVPKEKSIEKNLMDNWLKQSIKTANEKSINGKELTPYLIKEINKLSNNKTLEANIALIVNNALLASKLANKYFKLI